MSGKLPDIQSEIVPVIRIETERGSHVEPPLDQSWDDLTKLRWHAGVVTADTGLDVRVHQFKRGRYGVNVKSPTHSSGTSDSFDFYAMWTFLNGVSTGAQAARIPEESS